MENSESRVQLAKVAFEDNPEFTFEHLSDYNLDVRDLCRVVEPYAQNKEFCDHIASMTEAVAKLSPNVRVAIVKMIAKQSPELVKQYRENYALTSTSLPDCVIVDMAMETQPETILFTIGNYEVTQHEIFEILNKHASNPQAAVEIAKSSTLVNSLDELQRYEVLKKVAMECPLILQKHVDKFHLDENHKLDIKRIASDAARQCLK